MTTEAGHGAGTRAPRWLLAAGLAAGAALAAAGLIAPPDRALPPNAVARVNDRLILRDQWLRAVAAVASERRSPLSEADQRHILERLIDEELLVQHGQALGLVENDARLRSTLVSEVMVAASRRAAEEPDAAALRRFYDENRDFFAPALRLRVKAWRVGADGALVPFEPAVPDALLPPAKVATYLGPALAEQAAALPVNGTRVSLEAQGGRVVLELLERQASEPPPFEQILEQVRIEARRRADEAAVRTLLAELRGSTRIEVQAGP